MNDLLFAIIISLGLLSMGYRGLVKRQISFRGNYKLYGIKAQILGFLSWLLLAGGILNALGVLPDASNIYCLSLGMWLVSLFLGRVFARREVTRIYDMQTSFISGWLGLTLGSLAGAFWCLSWTGVALSPGIALQAALTALALSSALIVVLNKKPAESLIMQIGSGMFIGFVAGYFVENLIVWLLGMV